MSAINRQRLLFRHFAEIPHGQAVLCPILENTTVAAICNQLIGVLSHCGVQIVLDHQHDSCSLGTTRRVALDWPCVHGITRLQSVHVNPPKVFEFLSKLWSQHFVLIRWEITQRIAQRQFFLFSREDVFSNWSMAPLLRSHLERRQFRRNTLCNSRMKRLIGCTRFLLHRLFVFPVRLS